MAAGHFYMRPSRPAGQDARMDIVAVVLGVAMFAVLFGLIYGIDRI
jgi:hypothetical protein